MNLNMLSYRYGSSLPAAITPFIEFSQSANLLVSIMCAKVSGKRIKEFLNSVAGREPPMPRSSEEFMPALSSF